MELHHIQTTAVGNSIDKIKGRMDKQAHHLDKRWKHPDNFSCLGRLKITGRLIVKNKTKGIGASFHRHHGIGNSGYTADFHLCHLCIPLGNKLMLYYSTARNVP